MIPQEIPNRKFPSPPPFMYHPELFPDLAANNPAPSNLEIPSPKGPRRVRYPQPLKAKVVAAGKEKRVEIKTMSPELLKYHAGSVFTSYDADKLDTFQHELSSKFKRHFSASR